MSFYFLNESIRGKSSSVVPDSDFPVRIRTSTWEHLEDPRRLAKVYRFDDPAQHRHFVAEVMRSVGTMKHGVKITIEDDSVLVETRTKSIEDITELDIQIARECDQIFGDSQFILET